MGDMTTDFITVTARVAELERENAELKKRRTELQQCNTDYLERARKLAGKLSVAEAEIQQSHTDIEFWRAESVAWATGYGDLRQKVEKYERDVKVWVRGMRGYGRLGLLLDCFMAVIFFAVMFGLMEPIFR